VARLIDVAVAARDTRFVGVLFGALVASAIVEGFLVFARKRIVVAAQTMLRARFSPSQHAHLFRLPLSRFQERDHGTMIRSFDDLDRALDLATEILVDLATNVLLVVLFTGLMFFTHPLVALGVLDSITGSLVTAFMLGRRSRAAFGDWMNVRERYRERTLVVITHKMELASQMTRVVSIDGGHIEAASQAQRARKLSAAS